MKTFYSHVPGFIDSDQIKVEFETLAELLNHPFVERFSENEGFQEYVKSDECLMAIYDDGFKWWVVGYLKEPSEIDLPEWDKGLYLVKFEDKVYKAKGEQVRSSCGDRITLYDGRVCERVDHKGIVTSEIPWLS